MKLTTNMYPQYSICQPIASFFARHLRRSERRIFTIFSLALSLLIGTSAADEAEPFEGFLEQHCLRCHGPEKEEGDIRIDQLSRDFKAGLDTHQWAEALEKVNSGEMPPKEESRPTEDEIEAFVTSLNAGLKNGRAARMAARPAVAHYRLSRKEYQNTVYDLLGVRYDPTQPGELNEDTLWQGYERIGAQLSLSPSHIDRYYHAAEVVLDRAFSAASGETRKVRKTAAELRYGGGQAQQEALDRLGIKRPLRYLLFPGRVQNALSSNWFGKTGPEHSGLYRMRLQASGIRPPGGQLAHLSIGKQTSEETVEGLIEFDVTAPEDSPQVYEFEVFLEMPATLHFCVVATDVVDRRAGAAFRNALASRDGYIFTHSSETLLLNPNAPQMFDGEGNGIFSTVILDWIEWEGPLVTEVEKASRVGIVPPDNATPNVVAEHLQRFAQRAWRRPVNPQELDDYLQSYLAEREAGETLLDAYKIAMQGVLTSRHFIYLVEGSSALRSAAHTVEEPGASRPAAHEKEEPGALRPAAHTVEEPGASRPAAHEKEEPGALRPAAHTKEEPGALRPAAHGRTELTDWELASRLSYFLWSSMPDDELFSLCETNAMRVRLAEQVDRMLTDARSNRFIDDFSRQWLQLHRVGMFPPDKKLYPGYDDWLEASMRAEPVAYFREMFAKNLPVDDFLDSDWTMANARLCDFYGLPEPQADGFQHISLGPENHRGGLLTMGAVLGLTSDGTRHRPVHRGVWVSETIFNKTPPSPPANVEPIEPVPPTGTKITIRQRIEAHAKNASCAACHRNIDPLGLAFDQYDAVGQWRIREQVPTGVGEDPLVDASGVMPDGRPFSDSTNFKQLLIEDRDQVARAFIEHLCTYALRRVLTVDDEDDVQKIFDEAKKKQFGVRDIVRAVALSDLMKKR